MRFAGLLFTVLMFLDGRNALACAELLSPTTLKASEIELIQHHAKGVLPVSKFLEQAPYRGYLLGLSEPWNTYEALLKASGLESWETAYRRFGIDYGEPRHTQKFMDAITRSEDLTVVFLIPKNLWIHPGGVYTKREMYWLLSHPERMKNVVFLVEDRF